MITRTPTGNSKMKIKQIIGLDTLDPNNTEAENIRFTAAVTAVLKNEYPDVDITVELGQHSDIHISDYTDHPIYSNRVGITGVISKNIRAITNYVGEVMKLNRG